MKNYFFESLVKQKRKRVLIIFVGGTISMIKDPDSQALKPASKLEDLIRNEPELNTLADLELQKLYNLDSSDLNFGHWEKIAHTVCDNYEKYDGFVIAMGTDTMAYTASALSFLLKDLGKPVIITGSQFPLSGGMRTDARINLFNSILFAQVGIAEVAICFGNKLLRGNRSIKLDASKLDAFSSPNFPILGSIDYRINLNDVVKIADKEKRVGVEGCFCADVAIIKLVPAMSQQRLYDMISGLRGVVIEGFGSGGNIPKKLLPVIKEGIEKTDIQIALKSQCVYGNIDLSIYEGGHEARENGVLDCGDMTSESAFVKLAWLLGQDFESNKIRMLFEKDLRGERSMIDLY